MNGGGSQELFFGIHFVILTSEKLNEEQARELKVLLEERGATHHPLSPNETISDLQDLTHIISTHVDFPEYNAALDGNCNIVKPSWVEQSVTKGRQVQARQHSPDPALIFQDVVITCADLPQGDRDAITAGVLALGGMYSAPLTKLVTHIVSLSEEHDKIRVAREKNLNCSILLPHWFDDCLKLGKKISERPYQLPDPEILDQTIDRSPEYEPSDLTGATSAVPGRPPRVPPNRKNLTVFADKKIFFSKDLNVHDRLDKTLQEVVEFGGGSLAGTAQECDTYIGQYRDGLDYVQVSRAGKQVANLAWFYHVVTQNRWTNPTSRLLHYPVPRNGIEGFKGMKISISNYTGDSRLFLENVITEAGAEFTKTMKADNTHLITAHKGSEKCDAAQEWNIDIINHLWIEESYAKCQVSSLTNKRYTHFPPRIHLGEIVGQTQIDMDRVREIYFPDEEAETDEEEMPDAPIEEAVFRTSGTSAVEATAMSVDQTDGTAPDDSSSNGDAEATTPVPKAAKKRGPKVRDVATPSIDRRMSGKENEAPPSTGRASKLKAQQTLHMQKEDIALFEKEMKRKGGVIHGRKRHSEEVDEGGSATGEFERPTATQKQAKKAKMTASGSATVPIVHKMMVSGDDRWLGDAAKEREDTKLLRSLGIQLTVNSADCTLLCAPRLVRTRKFITAVACGPIVVNIGYLDHVLKYKSLGDPTKYHLKDKESEERFSFKLQESLERAKQNERKLLRGWTIYVTDKVNGGFDTYKDIVEANGGAAILYRGRTGVQLPRRRLKQLEDPGAGAESQNQGGDVETDFVYLVSGAADEDVKIWQTFRKMAEKQDLEARIVKTDWLLNSALSQQIVWDSKWEHE